MVQFITKLVYRLTAYQFDHLLLSVTLENLRNVLIFKTSKPIIKVRAQGYPSRPPRLPLLVKEVGGSPFRITAFYEGMGTIVARAMVLGATKMVCYNEVKDMLKKVPNHSDPRKRASSLQVSRKLIFEFYVRF